MTNQYADVLKQLDFRRGIELSTTRARAVSKKMFINDVENMLERLNWKRVNSNTAYGGFSATASYEKNGLRVDLYGAWSMGNSTTATVMDAPPPINTVTAVNVYVVFHMSSWKDTLGMEYPPQFKVYHDGTDQGKATGRDDTDRSVNATFMSEDEAIVAVHTMAKQKEHRNYNIVREVPRGSNTGWPGAPVPTDRTILHRRRVETPVVSS
jgi:hypothetical protein